ncbi:late embryogenesis abundant protein D-34-like [Salvia splendens]|uniref:late embryogenesis abundant protein D-34-like n=1 Tax=Salvia splendens TaxID=180675 RepID=UPI001C274380|nr:late embryogenesis abundant protein D-34-like [Salvia splendens]
MSQGQPQPVKYGDVFNVSGQLASQPISPQDAAALQAAETAAYGQTIKASLLDIQIDESKSTAAGDAVTIGEALEATALSAGNKPVDKSDVAAIQAAEVRAHWG